jgi:hypothetical protein
MEGPRQASARSASPATRGTTKACSPDDVAGSAIRAWRIDLSFQPFHRERCHSGYVYEKDAMECRDIGKLEKDREAGGCDSRACRYPRMAIPGREERATRGDPEEGRGVRFAAQHVNRSHNSS